MRICAALTGGGEAIAAYPLQGAGEDDAAQTVAAGEAECREFGHRVGDRDAPQLRAVVEAPVAHLSHGGGEVDLRETDAMGEAVRFQFPHRGGDADARQFRAVDEATFSQRCHGVGDAVHGDARGNADGGDVIVVAGPDYLRRAVIGVDGVVEAAHPVILCVGERGASQRQGEKEYDGA